MYHPTWLITAISACCISAAIQARELEEVIVTAQKREQNLQEVPVAVSAVSGAALEETVIKDVFDLQTNVPGLRIGQNQTATSSNFSIRGVGTSAQNFGLESSVGLYVDGVYRSRQSSMINNMVDMQAVEVLRGPQGTLFGKNSQSGAVQFKTVAPSHDGSDGFFRVTGGNYGLLNVSGAASVSAIDDVLAFRVTGFSSDRDGFVDVVGLDDDLNDRKRWGTRLQALYTPTDTLSVRVIADYSEIDEICCAAMTMEDNLGLTDQRSLFARSVGLPSSDSVVNLLGGTAFRGSDYFDYRTALNRKPASSNEDKGLSVEVNWDLAPAYTLTSVTAYRAFDSFDEIDADFTNLALIEKTNDAEQSSFSQEIRLTYEGERAKYVVGAYYFNQDIDLVAELDNLEALSVFASSSNPALAGLIGGTNQISEISGGALPPAADPFPAPFTAVDATEQEHQSWALFGQVDYNLTDSLILTLGLRYTDEEKDLKATYDQLGVLGPAAPDVSAILDVLQQRSTDFSVLQPLYFPGWGYYFFTADAPRPDLDVSETFEQVSGTVKLSWLASDDLMVYASYGTGFKSGGTNTDRISAALDPVFDPETSNAIEVGVKADFPDQAMRLNLALHSTDVEDFQANSFTGLGFNLQNAGELDTYGAEMELSWAPTEQLDVNLVYAYTVADFKKFESGNCRIATPFRTGESDPGDTDSNPDNGCDRSGDRVNGNPEHVATLSVKKGFNLTASITGYVAAEYNYISDTVLDGDNDPLKFQDDYELVNLRAGIRFEQYQTELTLWGRNVFDEEYYRTAFDVPLQDGRVNAYPGEPTTFGLTLNKHF